MSKFGLLAFARSRPHAIEVDLGYPPQSGVLGLLALLPRCLHLFWSNVWSLEQQQPVDPRYRTCLESWHPTLPGIAIKRTIESPRLDKGKLQFHDCKELNKGMMDKKTGVEFRGPVPE
jgi:hypothetical protein